MVENDIQWYPIKDDCNALIKDKKLRLMYSANSFPVFLQLTPTHHLNWQTELKHVYLWIMQWICTLLYFNFIDRHIAFGNVN